jgi:hypothetical protein
MARTRLARETRRRVEAATEPCGFLGEVEGKIGQHPPRWREPSLIRSGYTAALMSG